MNYQITPMTSAHLDQVEALEKICFPEDPWSRQIFKESLENPNSTNLVVQSADGAVRAFLIFTAVADEGNIDDIAVHPDFRRQGIAAALLERFRQTAMEQGLAFLTLEVRPSNRAAVELYRKMGYQEIGRRKNYYLSPKEDAIIMKLELTPCT